MSLFITFEGIEGCGKSTQLELLKGLLIKEGLPVTATREPGGTEIGEKIRSILLKEEGNKLFPLTELLLYISCRAQLIEEVIRTCSEERGYRSVRQVFRLNSCLSRLWQRS